MQTKHLLLIVLIALLAPSGVFGQICYPMASRNLHPNQVNATLHNGGDMFWDLVGNPGYEVPYTPNPLDKRYSMFAASVWIGGLDDGNGLHLAAQTYRESGHDFFSGPYRSSGTYSCDLALQLTSQLYPGRMFELSSGKVLTLQNTGIEVYHPNANNLSLHLLPQNMDRYLATELSNGKVLLYGEDPSSGQARPTVLVDSSTFAGTLHITLNFEHPESPAVQLANGQTLIVGPYGAEIYDPALGQSNAVAAPPVLRVSGKLLLLPNGEVLRLGGRTALWGGLGSRETEIYNPQNNSWTTGPNFPVLLKDPEVALLSNGEVLIVGGSRTSDDIYKYDPVSNQIRTAGKLGGGVSVQCMEELSNGNFIVSGKATNGNLGIVVYDPVLELSSPQALKINAENSAILPDGSILYEGEDGDLLFYDPVQKKLRDHDYQYIWKVDQADIDAFLADFANGSLDMTDYPDIATWPAHGNRFYGEDAHLAPFVDVNMDGDYRPGTDGDYPCISGTQMLWWVYNDDALPHTETGADKMGIQVEASAYGYDCQQMNCPDSSLDYTTFYHYEIANKSSNDYHDVYIGVWLDVDIGNFADDFVGCDSNLALGFAYNGDAMDEGVAGYGLAAPAVGSAILDVNGAGPRLNSMMYYENDFTLRGNPEYPEHYYNYMNATWKNGDHLVDNGSNGFPATAPGPATNFMFPGDAGFCPGSSISGWSEVSSQNQPFDRRILQGIGPFTLAAGDSLNLDFAVVWAQGTDHLNSVCKLKQNTQAVQNFWASQSSGCFRTPVSNEEPVESLSAIEVFPNPGSGKYSIDLGKSLNGEVNLRVFDLKGKQLVRQQWSAGQRIGHLDISHLAKGLYILEIQNGSEQHSEKLIKY